MVAVAAHDLLDHHRQGVFGFGRAGDVAGALDRIERTEERTPRTRLTGDAQTRGKRRNIFVAHGPPIHGGDPVQRKVALGLHRLREHPALGVGDRHAFDAKGPDLGDEPLDRFVESDHEPVS